MASTSDESSIIEKIDIGGISLIRAAAKNYKDVVIVPSQAQYQKPFTLAYYGDGITHLEQRRSLAAAAFEVSSHYDSAIYQYFAQLTDHSPAIKLSVSPGQSLCDMEKIRTKKPFLWQTSKKFLGFRGKELSYNNLVDVDAAMALMSEFQGDKPTLPSSNTPMPVGASRNTVLDAWNAALAPTPFLLFGGIFIPTGSGRSHCQKVDKLFYEILIAPSYSPLRWSAAGKEKKNHPATQSIPQSTPQC